MFRAIVDAFKNYRGLTPRAETNHKDLGDELKIIPDPRARLHTARRKLREVIQKNHKEGCDTSRGVYLAYAFLCGTPYRKVEPSNHPHQKNEAWEYGAMHFIMTALSWSGFLKPESAGEKLTPYPAYPGASQNRYDAVKKLVEHWARVGHPEVHDVTE